MKPAPGTLMDHYVIRVDATLPDNALEGFEGLVVTQQKIQTVLHGELPDQAALAGVLDHLDELGVVILEVLKVPDSADATERAAEGGPTPSSADGERS